MMASAKTTNVQWTGSRLSAGYHQVPGAGEHSGTVSCLWYTNGCNDHWMTSYLGQNRVSWY